MSTINTLSSLLFTWLTFGLDFPELICPVLPGAAVTRQLIEKLASPSQLWAISTRDITHQAGVFIFHKVNKCVLYPIKCHHLTQYQVPQNRQSNKLAQYSHWELCKLQARGQASTSVAFFSLYLHSDIYNLKVLDCRKNRKGMMKNELTIEPFLKTVF